MEVPDHRSQPSVGGEMGQPAAETFSGDPDRWRRYQEALAARGVPVPLEHDWRWIRDVLRVGHCYVVDRGSDGEARAGAPVRRHAVRSVPGHHRLRVTRCGHGAEPAGVSGLLEALRLRVQRDPRLLGVNVEIFTPDARAREHIARVARGQEFRRVEGERRYRRTARIDVSDGEEAVFAGFTGSCRRAIREPGKKGYRVEPLTDSAYAVRMDRLWAETFERTGSRPPRREWARHLAFARDHPDLYRIVGTFGPGFPEPGSLMAFSCGMHNGDHVVYSDGASTRDPSCTVTLSYAPMWTLIRWAATSGCSWFDMGGISEGTDPGDGDPRRGIDGFKRRFTRDVVEVGAEWCFEPASLRSWLSARIRRSASGLREAWVSSRS
jgi:hypothetical protein